MEKQLVAFIGSLEDLPARLIDNEYIKTGYRINYKGFCPIFKTMFKRHNETFNIWSHFIGKLVALTLSILIIYGNPVFINYNHQDLGKNLSLIKSEEISTVSGETAYVSKWPLVVHLVAASLCLGFSALFHLFFIYGDKTYDMLSRLDYGGISILIMGSSYPPIFYCFSCPKVFWIRDLFLALITLTSTSSFIATLHPIMNTPKLRTCRAYIFIFLGISAGLPFFFLMGAPDSIIKYTNPSQTATPWAVGGLVYIGGALIYAFRVPEKHYPKKFDNCG